MKIAVVLTFDAPEPEEITRILSSINPPRHPWFDGKARVVVEPHVHEMIAWLDEGEGSS